MAVTLAQLEVLRAVARHGSFTHAAKTLGVTQPAVSQSIAVLQQALGLQLVEIRKSRPHLTEAGRFVATRANAIAGEVDILAREARGYAEGLRGILNIAATLTIGTYVLPKLLARFITMRENVAPRVSIINTSAAVHEVLEANTALGLVEGRVDDPRLDAQAFARDRLVLIAPLGAAIGPLADEIDAHDLADVPFISREVGSGTRDFGYEALRSAGVEPRLMLELPSGEAIVNAVEAGLGVAIISERVAAAAIAARTLRACALRGLDLERSFWLVRVRDRRLSPVAQAFADLVLEGMTQQGSPA